MALLRVRFRNEQSFLPRSLRLLASSTQSTLVGMNFRRLPEFMPPALRPAVDSGRGSFRRQREYAHQGPISGWTLDRRKGSDPCQRNPRN